MRINLNTVALTRDNNQYGVTAYPSFFVMRHANSAPLNINPFRRAGVNLTPAQFVTACQQAASVPPQAPNSIGISRSLPGRTNITPSAGGGATQTTKTRRLVEVPTSAGGSPNFITNASLPTLDAVLTKYVEAIGGNDAQRRITSRVTKARVDVPGVSFGGKLEVYTKAPNKSLTMMKVEPFGVLKQGFDGRTSWNLSDKGSRKSNRYRARRARGCRFLSRNKSQRVVHADQTTGQSTGRLSRALHVGSCLAKRRGGEPILRCGERTLNS